MTQAAEAPAAAPVVNPEGVQVPSGQPIQLSASEQGEPTVEELAALVPDSAIKETPTEAAAETAETTETVTEGVAPVEQTAAATTADAAEIDAAAERAAKAAAKAREGSRRYAEQQRQLAEQAASVRRAAAEAERVRQENAEYARREAAYKADPYKALKEAGMTDVDLAQRALRENTPEAAILRAQEKAEAAEARVQALEKRIAEERAAAERAEYARQAESSFIEIAKDADTYPELALRSPKVQLTAAREALAQIRANGHDTRHLTNEQIAEAAEIWLRPVGEKPKPKPAAAAPVAKPVVKTSGKTLTNAVAQTRTVAPANWDSLTDEQQLAHIAAMLPEPTG